MKLMELPIASPSNRFLVPQRDRRWPHVFSVVVFMSAVVLTALFLVGWPRLRRTTINYDLIELRSQVKELERREHELRLELELVRSPGILAEQARQGGLVPPTPVDLVTAPGVEVRR